MPVYEPGPTPQAKKEMSFSRSPCPSSRPASMTRMAGRFARAKDSTTCPSFISALIPSFVEGQGRGNISVHRLRLVHRAVLVLQERMDLLGRRERKQVLATARASSQEIERRTCRIVGARQGAKENSLMPSPMRRGMSNGSEAISPQRHKRNVGHDSRSMKRRRRISPGWYERAGSEARCSGQQPEHTG